MRKRRRRRRMWKRSHMPRHCCVNTFASLAVTVQMRDRLAMTAKKQNRRTLQTPRLLPSGQQRHQSRIQTVTTPNEQWGKVGDMWRPFCSRGSWDEEENDDEKKKRKKAEKKDEEPREKEEVEEEEDEKKWEKEEEEKEM